MCGIAGHWGEKDIATGRIEATLGRMKNRGPDARAAEIKTLGSLRTHLLHSRLAIIDLETRSNQPFHCGPWSIVYNGEVYNYKEVRSELQSCGVRFQTESDTEVLIQAWAHWGPDCLDKLEGMWAFALWNQLDGSLVLCRDRFGEKPLYWTQRGRDLYFGSEVKFVESLLGESLSINFRHLRRTLAYGYKAIYKTPDTHFENLREVPRATWIRFSPGQDPIDHRYWKPEVQTKPSMTFEEASSETRRLLEASLKLRMRADVPVAFCLSGGVDSAALISLAAKQFNYPVSTFSIVDKDPRYDEEPEIMATVKDVRCESSRIHLRPEGQLERLTNLIRYHDAPVATISYFVHSFLSEEISKRGFKVSISGTSADELFTGYYDHFLLHLAEIRHTSHYPAALAAWREHILPVTRNPVLQDPDLYVKNPGYRDHVFDGQDANNQILVEPFLEEYSEERFCESLLRNRMLNELTVEATPVILREDDLNSMLFSIENRSPYLDRQLIEFAYSIPAQHLIRDGYAKAVLRDAMKGILNERVRTLRQKKGFNASIYSIVNFSDPETLNFLLDPTAEVFRIVKRDQIASAIERRDSSNAFSKFLFSFINARIFMDRGLE